MKEAFRFATSKVFRLQSFVACAREKEKYLIKKFHNGKTFLISDKTPNASCLFRFLFILFYTNKRLLTDVLCEDSHVFNSRRFY